MVAARRSLAGSFSVEITMGSSYSRFVRDSWKSDAIVTLLFYRSRIIQRWCIYIHLNGH